MNTNEIIERRKAIDVKLGQIRYALDQATTLVDALTLELGKAERELVEVDAELQRSLIR